MNPTELIKEKVAELRKQSAGYGFVTDESIEMFEKHFVIPILTQAYLCGVESKEKPKEILEECIHPAKKFNYRPDCILCTKCRARWDYEMREWYSPLTSPEGKTK